MANSLEERRSRDSSNVEGTGQCRERKFGREEGGGGGEGCLDGEGKRNNWTRKGRMTRVQEMNVMLDLRVVTQGLPGIGERIKRVRTGERG